MRLRSVFAPLLAAMVPALFACADGGDQAPEAADTVAAVADPPATVPTQWQIRADSGHQASDGLAVTAGDPGTRITSGGFSGILYQADQVARGTYEVIATIHVLPGSRRTEGYGVFVGGSGLDGDDQRYTYFLLRNDGHYLVKTREGSATSTVVDWTPSPAINILAASAGAGESAANTMVVRVTPETVTLLVNGERVVQRPRGDLPADGLVGLRVNHGLELHVHTLDVAAPGVPAE